MSAQDKYKEYDNGGGTIIVLEGVGEFMWKRLRLATRDNS